MSFIDYGARLMKNGQSKAAPSDQNVNFSFRATRSSNNEAPWRLLR